MVEKKSVEADLMGTARKKYIFRDDEIVYGIEAYKRDDESNIDLDALEEDDYFLGTFDSFTRAVRKYLELKDEGWEIVNFVIKPRKKVRKDVSFIIHDNSVTIFVDLEKINERLSRVIRKIEEALDDLK